MATKSFAVTPAEPETTEALSTYSDPAPAFTSSDIQIPRLTVVQKMSELDIDAPVGSIVHNKDTVLYRAGVKVPAIVLFAHKFWKEDIPFDSDEVPQFVRTQAEADEIAAQNGPDGYKIITGADIGLLIAKTDDAESGSDDAFPFELDGRHYALGKFTVQKKSYDTTFKALASFSLFNPKTPPNSIHWTLNSFLVTKGKYSWYVPSLSPTKDAVGSEAAEFASRLQA